MDRVWSIFICFGQYCRLTEFISRVKSLTGHRAEDSTLYQALCRLDYCNQASNLLPPTNVPNRCMLLDQDQNLCISNNFSLTITNSAMFHLGLLKSLKIADSKFARTNTCCNPITNYQKPPWRWDFCFPPPVRCLLYHQKIYPSPLSKALSSAMTWRSSRKTRQTIQMISPLSHAGVRGKLTYSSHQVQVLSAFISTLQALFVNSLPIKRAHNHKSNRLHQSTWTDLGTNHFPQSNLNICDTFYEYKVEVLLNQWMDGD